MTVDPDAFRRPLSIADLFPDASPAEWRRLAVHSIKGGSFDSLGSATPEGIRVKPLYTADDTRDLPADGGLHAGSVQPWRVCQRYDHPDPAVVSNQVEEDAERGVDGVWLRFDRTVRLGWHEAAVGTGRPHDGMVVFGVHQIEGILEAAGAARTAVHLDAGGSSLAVAAATIAAADRCGLARDALEFRFNIDPLAALVADGELAHGLEFSLSSLADMVSWTSKNAPGCRALAVSTLPYNGAGASAVSELAYGLATAVEYLRRMAEGGVAIETGIGQLRFIYGVGRDFFMEVAKLRAARRLWRRIAEACAVDAGAVRTEIHAVTSPRCLAARDPWVNLLRTTVQGTAAVVGGADAVTVLPFDTAIGPSDGPARRLAANTHAILREESHLHRVADPAAGGWYVERLTHDLAEGAWTRFQQIEALGGMTTAVTSGVIHHEMAEAHAARRHSIATRHDPVTGVTTFPNLDEEPLVRQPPGEPPDQGSDLASGRRSPLEKLHRLVEVRREETRDGSLISAALDALSAGARIPEIVLGLADADGPTRCEVLPQDREGEIFERLRDASDVRLDETGQRPRAFLAAVGPPAEHRNIREFAVNMLAAGGIEAVEADDGGEWDAVVSGFENSGARTAVIVVHPEHADQVVPELARTLKERGALRVLVAAAPDTTEGAWRAAGVDGFLCADCDAHEALRNVMAAAGWLS